MTGPHHAGGGPILQFELLVVKDDQRSHVVWDGDSGLSAALAYVASHPDCKVLAWRSWPRHGFFPAVDIRRVVP
jgi:hypothetical protein